MLTSFQVSFYAKILIMSLKIDQSSKVSHLKLCQRMVTITRTCACVHVQISIIVHACNGMTVGLFKHKIVCWRRYPSQRINPLTLFHDPSLWHTASKTKTWLPKHKRWLILNFRTMFYDLQKSCYCSFAAKIMWMLLPNSQRVLCSST